MLGHYANSQLSNGCISPIVRVGNIHYGLSMPAQFQWETGVLSQGPDGNILSTHIFPNPGTWFPKNESSDSHYSRT